MAQKKRRGRGRVLTGRYPSSRYTRTTLLPAVAANPWPAYPTAAPTHPFWAAMIRPNSSIPIGPMTAGMTSAGRRYSGSGCSDLRAVILTAIKSMSRPPMKKEMTAPTNPEIESNPILCMVQFHGGAVKVCDATSCTTMLLEEMMSALFAQAQARGLALPAYKQPTDQAGDKHWWIGDQH